MILRCRKPRKKEPDRPCGGFVTAIPSADSRILWPVERVADADPDHQVCGCLDCGKLYELAERQRLSA